MKALFRMIFSHKGHKEPKEGNMEVGMNDSTIQRSNHQTFQRSNAAEECTMHNAPCTMSGMKTSRAPRGRLGHVARWAAVAAVAAGTWLGLARDVKADVYMCGDWNSWTLGSAAGKMYVDNTFKTGANDTMFYVTITNSRTTDSKYQYNNGSWGWQKGAGTSSMTADSTVGDINGSGDITLKSPTSGKQYTFRADVSAQKNVVMKTSGTPVNITGATGPSGVAAGNDAKITITTSAEPPSEQKIYVRYTTDDWSTKSLTAAAEGSGTTWTATIPASANTAGKTVKYYVLSSTMGTSSINSYPDLCTLRGNNNGGANWSYTVTATAWGDTVKWDPQANQATTNWDGAANWWNTSKSVYDNLNSGTGGRSLHFDNNKNLNMGNNLSVDGSTNRWQIIFEEGNNQTRTIRGTEQHHFYDNSKTPPKIENYASVEHRVLFPIAIGYWTPNSGQANGLEVNPVHGDIVLTNVSARGQALRVFGDEGHRVSIHNWYSGSNTANAASSTIYVDDASEVYINQMNCAGASLRHTINVKNAAGRVIVSNLYWRGTANSVGNGGWDKMGSGEFVLIGNGSAIGTNRHTMAVKEGAVVFSNAASISTKLLFANLTLTNNATLVMHSPAQVKRLVLNAGDTVEMDVFSNSSAAYLGVDPTATSLVGAAGNYANSATLANGGSSTKKTTLKLKYTSGFNGAIDGSFMVFEGRNSAGCMSDEAEYVEIDPSDMTAHGVTGTFTLTYGKNSQNSANNSAVYVTYTAPVPVPTVSTPTAEVTGTDTATLGATVEANHGKSITDYGIVYSKTVAEPEVGASGCTKAQKGTTTPTSGAAWTVNVTGLTPGTTYYYRGYATSSAGTGYSSVETFTTLRTQTVTVGNLTFTYGDSASALSVTVTGGSGTRTYSSSDEDVATVDSSGNVTPHAVGTATITVNVASDGTYEAKSGTCTVTVNRATPTVTLKKGSATSGSVDVAASVELTAATSAGSGTFTFSASPSTSVTLVQGTGADANKVTVTGVRAGTVTITATADQTATHNAASGTFTLTVNTIKPVLSTPTATVTGTTTATLGATVASDGGQAPSAWAWGGIQWKPSSAGWTAATVASNTWSSAPSEGGAYTINVTGLTPGTHYDYRGMGKNSKGWNTASDATGSFYTKCATPGAAGELTITQISDAQLNLNWSAATATGGGNTYYVVFRRTTSAVAPTVTDGTAYTVGQTLSGWTVAGTDITQTSLPFTDTGLTQATRYYYAVYAYRKNTENSTIAYASSASTGNELTWSTAPSSVGTLSATGLGSQRAKLTWTKAGSESGVLVVVVTSGTPEPVVGTTYTGTGAFGPSGGGSALGNGYVVYRGTSAQTDFTVTGLTPSTSYTAYLFPYNVGSDAATVNYGPSRSASFSTGAPSGPAVTAAGVDANGMTMAWGSVGGASSYDVEASGIGTANVPFSTAFSTWTDVSGKKNTTVSKAGGTWTLHNVYGDSGNGRVYFYYTDQADAWLELPPLYGVVTNIVVAIRPASTGVRGAWLEFYEGDAWVPKAYFRMDWTRVDREADKVKFVYAQPFIAKGQRVRIRNNGSSSDSWTLGLYSVSVEGGNPAESLKGRTLPVVGLSSGNSVTLSASAAGTGDYGSATVMAGVVPGDVDTEKTWNSLTFTWDAPSVGTCVGYEVETASADAGWADDVVCEGSALSSSSYSSSGWKYNGVTASGSSGTVKSAPTYNNGHCLVGKSGIGMESTDYDIAGATELELKYRVCAWNLSGASPSTDDAKTDVGRIEAYYKIDGGDWNFLGSSRPSFTNDNYYTDVTNRLTEGMLNGRTVAFKLIAPNAAGDGGTYLRGAYIQSLRIHKVSSLAGNYTTPLDTDTLEVGTETFTVSGLAANTKRHFRVRALQGTDIDHITARSVWVEATETTSGFPGPAVEVTGTTRYSLTAGWAAYSESDAGNYDVSYRVQITGCPNAGAEATTASECPALNLDFGTGTGAWTYQRGASGSTLSAYPKYEGSVHKVWGQYSSMSTYPGIESPAMNLSGYASASVDFTHMYVNQSTFSEVALYYSLNSGSTWTLVTTTGEAGGYTIATGTSRSLALPPEALVDGVMVKLVALHASSYPVTVDGSTTYYARGASIYGLKVTARGAGGGDYSCAYASDVHTTTGTSFTFSEDTIGSDAKLKGLVAGSNYYVRVQTVLTPKSGAPAGTTAAESLWSEAGAKTGDPQSPPESISATAIKQQSMTLVWPEADGATEDTKYWVQASSCAGTAWTETAVQPSSTTADLGEGDDWHYVGGGTEVTSSQQTDGHITGRGVYPAYAAGSEKSQVLAGAGTPGIESIAFSTVGVSGGTLTFGHGRWYNASDLSTAELTATYSIDGGETWESIGTSAGSNAKEFVTSSGATRTMSLPAGALGHASVIVRIEATTAAVVSSVPVGAAVGSATVTLTGNPGNYTGSGCKILDVAGLSHDQLTQALSGLTANTPYYFRVCASDGLTSTPQYGAWVDGMAKTLDVPATPATPWAVNIGRHTMTIRWTEAERAETYTLKVYSNSGCTTEVASFTGLTGTEQAVSGLEASTPYWFKVTAHSDGTSGSASAAGTATTVNTLSITGLSVTNILETTLTVKWDSVSGDTYTLDWGPVSDEGLVSTAEEIPAPGSSLKRSDAGNGWSYFGGNGSYPAYWKGSTAGDEGHALIYATGGQPGIQSRWFSTFGVTNAVVDFYHGRFNSGADSTVVVTYSLDGGSTWSTAGTAESTAVSTPTEHRQIALPAEALGKRSVMVRLTASGANGNKGAHVKDLKVVLQSGKGAATRTGVSVSGGTYTLSAPSQSIAAGTRYWFKLTATEGGETATAETTAATRTKTTGVLRSQGFEGSGGALDTSAWGYTISYKNVSGGGDAGSKTAGTQRPVVEVVSGQNPLYGDRALRMSGSANADVFGVVDFDNLNSSVLGSASANVTVTIPFAAQDLAQNDYLYVSYSTDNGSTWLAPGGTADQTSMGSVKMTRIGKGGGDVINRNWPYNRGTNSTTRPKGDAYTFDLTGISQLKLRVAFCGQTGGAARYYFIDEVTVSLNPSAPSPVSASANSSGNVDLTWTPATGQGAVIIRGQDMRNPPSFTDLNSLPAGYEVVTNASGGVFFENATRTWTDTGAVSGNKYFYYFYGAVPAGTSYSLSKTPNVAETIIKGMVNAIASQGWDGWDVHPWGYRLGRVSNPGRSSDYGWWKAQVPSQNGTPVVFYEDEFELDTGSSTADGGFVHADVGNHKYADYYGSDDDGYKQLGLTSLKSYIGGHSFRLSGGGSWTWSGSHVWVDYSGNTKTNSNVDINTNNAAIEFANVDLSGYKNVEFQMHFAGQHLNGGNDLHVAISTNGGGAGTWLEVGNDNAAGWKVHESHYDYGRAISDGDTRLSGNWDFYFEDSASATPYGNPYVLEVPDSVTQIMVRVMFYDSNGGSRRNASYFIDEVRLVGEVALETPHPIMTDISKTSFTATWEPIEGASSYNVKVTSVEATDKVKLTEAFALSAVPLQWKASASGVAFPTTASYSGKAGDYGLSLTGEGGWLASPEVGAANKVTFNLKAASGAPDLKLQASEDGGTTWETVATYTASGVGASWTLQSVDLPRRQWEKIRFYRADSGANWYVDNITIYGGGNYATTVTTRDGLTATSLTVSSGVSEGTEYFVSVQAYGAPNGVPTVSGWGETADYTPGTFTVKSDGFEMTRLGGTGSSSARLLVVAITDTDADYDDLPTPGVDTTVSEGTSLAGGKAVVVKNVTSTFSNFEHVWPHGSRTEPVEAKYVAFWKHGNYWEGRLETNVTLGAYVCQAADAMAITNSTAVPAGTQGKGWAAGWKPWDDDDAKASPDYISVLQSSTTESGYTYYGLVGSNKLAGAGGNAIRFTMTDASRKLRLARALSAPVADGEVWIMFQVRSQYGGDNDDKMFGMQLSTGTDAATAGDGIFASIGNMKYRYGDGDARAPRLQIDTSVDGSWPGGSGISWDQAASGYTPYELKDTGNQGSGTHTVVIKYDVGAKKIYAAGIYTTTAATIANNGPLAPNSTAPTFHCVATLSSKKTLGTIILLGKGYNGNLDFDEVRVGSSWEDIVGKETEAPFPVTSATAWTDGNELVRISWTYADEGTDTSVVPNVERPLASGVRIYAREGTSGEWTEIYKGTGTNEAAVAAGAGSRWDHVVAPGSTHQYQVVAYSSGKSAPAVNAVLKDSAPASYDVETGLYGETEYVNPFAYTNWATWSSESGRQWTGGNGFGDNAWTAGGAGIWSIATPEEAQAAVHITNVVTGSRLAAGNVLKVVLGDYETADIYRTLGGDAWCGKGGQTFYVAFRMAYQYGNGAGRQVGLRLTDSTGTYVQFGKARGDGEGFQNHFGINAKPYGDPSADYGTGWSNGGSAIDDIRGYHDAGANAAFLVVAKVNWSADNKANLRAVHYGIGTNGTPATLPAEEKDVTWEAYYDNAAIQAISKIELIAGTKPSSEGGYGQIGTAWFDEIRFGTSWEDIVGATEPEDAWVDGISATAYLGDYARWYMYGWPKGPKQNAWVSLATSTAFTTILATNGTTWVDNAPDRSKERTKWQGGEIQFTQTGTLYGGGSVKGELVTINSWTRTAADECKWNTYTVDPLPLPTSPSAVGGTAKVTLRWTPTTVSGRTFEEVMVVRYTGETVPEPVQGTTYLKGQTLGGGTVVYRGTATSFDDKGLTKNTTYNYAFFTVNNSYYSTAVTRSATTDENDPPIVIDGDPIEWVGVPSEVKNSSTLSSGEWIWTDKVLDGRVDKPAAYDADITEFRMKVDNNGYVNFMARLHCLTNKQNPYISVGIVTNVDATRLATTGNEDGENWIGDESATFMGGNLFEPASLHYADIQMAVHWVTTAGANGVASGSGGWVVELYKKDGNSWFAPAQAWEAASSDNGAADPCIEWKVKRSDLGLDYANVTPARFTVASFANGGGWNNDTEATVDLSSGKSHAVDTLCIAPWGVNDKDLSLTAWDEGIQKGNAEYWFDIWFGPTALHNAAPNAPAEYTLDGNPAVNGQKVSASPTMRWSQCADHSDLSEDRDLGFVVGYLVEVSTNEYFNGKEGTTENGPISCRVNLEGADNTSYRYKTDSRYYWWRVRARDNSGALSAPTPWHYEVEGKTDNEGPEARLLFVGKDNEVARYVSDASFRHEQDMSGDGKSVLDSDLEDGGHTFGFVIEWYDVNGVFATNWLRAWKEGVDPASTWPSSASNPYGTWTGETPSVGDLAWNILAEHSDGTPYGRVSPNWDLIIVDRSTVGKDSPTVAKESVNGTDYNYVKRTDLVLPTDDGGTETLEKVWIIDCGLDRVFQPTQMINDGNDGQYITNHVQGAFAIGTYRTDLDIYLTVSAEDSCRTGPYAETADYDWPLYDDEGDTGSYKAQGSASGTLSGYCAAAPNPSRNVTTNQLLHIHVRDNDVTPPVTSQAKWRADATGEGGTALLPMMAVAITNSTVAKPGSWTAAWSQLAAVGRVPTQEGQGKALQWQLTDADVANGGTWYGSDKKLRLFFNVYDEYLHSGLASFSSYDAGSPASGTLRAVATGSYTSLADKTRTLNNSGLLLGESTDWTGFLPDWSVVTQYPWDDDGDNPHGAGTGMDSVLVWQFDATAANLQALLGKADLLSNASIGTNAAGEQLVVTNSVKLFAWDNDNNAEGDQEGAELEFGQMIFTDDDATAPETPGYNLSGTGTNMVHFGDVAYWKWTKSGDSYTLTQNPMAHITQSSTVEGYSSSGTSDASGDTSGQATWSTANSVWYFNGGMGGTDYRDANNKYFQFTVQGDGNTVWSADTVGFNSRVSANGPTNFVLTFQVSGGSGANLESYAVSGSGNSGGINSAWTAVNAAYKYDGNWLAKYRDGIVITTPSGTTASLTSPSANLANYRSGTLTFKVARIGSTANTRKMYVKYSTDNWVSETTLATYVNNTTDFPNGTGSQATSGNDTFRDETITIPAALMGQTKTLQLRFDGEGLASASGFKLVDVKLTMVANNGEVEVARLSVEKDLDDEGGYASATWTPVSMGFNGMTLRSDAGTEYTFRLYGFGASKMSDSVVTPANNGTWGIDSLFLHGIGSEPKKDEVTDHDLRTGGWTNRLEVMDGVPAGYDTTRSGLQITGAKGPQFILHYPTNYSDVSDAAVAGGSGTYALKKAATATFNTIADPDFTAGNGAWTLTDATITTANGGRLTLLATPEAEEGKPAPVAVASSASQTFALTSMAGVTDVTVSGAVRMRAKTVTGGVNGVDVVVKLLNASDGELATHTYELTAGGTMKNHPLEPWAQTMDDVAKVQVTIKQRTAAGTEIIVDECTVRMAQWGALIDSTSDAWAATIVDGIAEAKLLAGTTPMDLRTSSVPLTEEITKATLEDGTASPYYDADSDGLYRMEAKVWDADNDRADDALSVSMSDKFELFDDDKVAPQWGRMFGGPLGVFLNGKQIGAKQRTGEGVGMEWVVSDAELTALAPANPLMLSLSFYDYSGWNTKSLSIGSDAVQSAGAVADTETYEQPVSEGAEGVPSATNTWTTTVGQWYAKYSAAFGGGVNEANNVPGIHKTVTANVADLDNDRANDVKEWSGTVGSIWFTDQDVQAPVYGNQYDLFAGFLIATNVPNYAALKTIPEGGVSAYPYALGGDLTAHQAHTQWDEVDDKGDTVTKHRVEESDVSGRSFTIYDGQLAQTGVGGNGKFVVSVNVNDPTPGATRGRSNTGVRRGMSKTESVTVWGGTDYAMSFTATNTFVTLDTAASGGTVVLDGSSNFGGEGEGGWSESIGKSKNAMQAGYLSWVWDSFSAADVGTLLPSTYGTSENPGRTLYWKVHAYDADTNRAEDQKSSLLAGPAMMVRDNDTQRPNPPTGVEVNGSAVPGGTMTRDTAPWTNDLSNVDVRFTAATDPAATGLDIKSSGIARYQLAEESETVTQTSTNLGKAVTTSVVGEKLKANIGAVTMDQGFGKYHLFAVDADDDRPGDGLASTPADVPLAYDITKPTVIGISASARLVADPDNTDDPTTQFDLTWPTTGVGPDAPGTDEYKAIPKKYTDAAPSANDVLSPWYSYKVYYTNYDENSIAADDNPTSDTKSWVYTNFITTKAYMNWTSVTASATAADPTAPTNSEGRSVAYASLGVVSNNASASQKIRLYDLDFDQHYVVVIVGVDKAGNEGPAGLWSWATNNTIKFAVTQGVVRASATINTWVGDVETTNSVGLAKIRTEAAEGYVPPKHGVVLYWKAAGMNEVKYTNTTTGAVTTNLEGIVKKEYDLIYRYADSFSEDGSEQWSMATDGVAGNNSGTSMTNWNYQADTNLMVPGRMRFYRASYHNRWQDKKPGTQEKQTPLASEEVYSMNNIILSEGFNYVSLQGVPYTNTFRGVFGTDREVWPPNATEATSTNGAVVVEFYQPGTNTMIKEQYFFASDGEWYKWDNVDGTVTLVTDTLQAPDFFMRPFSINLPGATMTVDGETKEVEWWNTHNDNKDNALGARYGSRTNLMAMIWHPILQVPTNGVVPPPAAASASAATSARDGTDGAGLVFKQTIHRAMNGTNVYNTLSLNLPVSVNPSKLCLVAFDKETGKPTTVPADMKMKTGIPQLADKLYVVDSKTKEVRGNSTMYCDADGVWRYNSNKTPVTGNVIKPNDMLILISVSGSGTWEWTYSPEDFYEPPNRHMGRDRL